jgi:hypothetical protein
MGHVWGLDNGRGGWYRLARDGVVLWEVVRGGGWFNGRARGRGCQIRGGLRRIDVAMRWASTAARTVCGDSQLASWDRRDGCETTGRSNEGVSGRER